MATPTPMAPRCPACGAGATWHPAIQKWGCDHCRQLLPGQGPAQTSAPSPQHPNVITNPHHLTKDGGAAVGKVVLWIVVITILVVIKLAIRGAI